MEYTKCRDYKQLLWRLNPYSYFIIQLWGYKYWKYGKKINLRIWEYFPYKSYSLDLFCFSVSYRK